MRLLTLLISLLFFGESLIAQDAFSFKAQSIPEVTGLLKGYQPERDSGMVIKYSIVVPTPERQREKTTKPNPDGTFALELDFPIRRTQVWVHIGELYFGHIMADKGLEILVDLDKLHKAKRSNFFNPHVTYAGPDADINTYLGRFTQFEIARRPLSNPMISIMQDREATPDEKWLRLERDVHGHMKEVMDKYIAKYPGPYEDLLWDIWQSERLSFLFLIYRNKPFPDTLANLALNYKPKIFTNESVLNYMNYQGRFHHTLSEQERLMTIVMVKDSKRLLPAQQEQIQEYVFLEQARRSNGDLDTDRLNELRKQILADHDSVLYEHQVDLFRQKVMQAGDPEVRDLMRMVSGEEDVWKRSLYMRQVLQDMENPWLAEIMKTQWEENKDDLRKMEENLASIKVAAKEGPLGEELGTMDNGARMIQAADQSLDDLLASLRKDIGNKPMLIDLWATWCAPCISDMEESKPNIEKLREMGVEVVYLCTTSGSSVDRWKNRVAQMDLPTRHIYLTDAQSDEIMEKFNLRGFPSHLFFDADGQYYPDVVHSIGRAELDVFEEYLDK